MFGARGHIALAFVCSFCGNCCGNSVKILCNLCNLWLNKMLVYKDGTTAESFIASEKVGIGVMPTREKIIIMPSLGVAASVISFTLQTQPQP